MDDWKTLFMHEKITEMRNGKHVIPLRNAICGNDLPYWAICNRSSPSLSRLEGVAADKLAYFEEYITEKEGEFIVRL